MNKLIFGAILFVFFSVSYAHANRPMMSKNGITSMVKSSEILLTYEIYRVDLKKELSALIDDKFNEDFIKKNPYAYVTIVPSRNPDKLVVTIQSDGKPVSPVEMVVCKGGGISFVKCCKSYLDKHPKGCLKITQDDGTYYANNNC